MMPGRLKNGERLQAYEQERWRSARMYAVGTSVTTDGKDYYVSGIYDNGVESTKKREGYDITTGVDIIPMKTVKKLEVKNTNFKK